MVLAAPDIDAALFRSHIDQLLAGNATGVTLYGSQKDRAMWASYAFNHIQPIGTLEPLYPVKGLVQIAATAVSTNFVGHDYFVSAPVAVSDIAAILATPHKPPPRLLKQADSNGYTYWQLHE